MHIGFFVSCRGDVGHLSGAELSRIENLFLRNEHPIGGWAWAYWSRSSSTREVICNSWKHAASMTPVRFSLAGERQLNIMTCALKRNILSAGRQGFRRWLEYFGGEYVET